ncbi:sodium/calcium exchanger protein [Hirsutella rhossiliensis]|uniref:Sodium/calcium exchanger protein n=1 Tax=Hirsutella rhossiliensis TaxID=111463 RepID=A0A9P8SM66_9HYPO|nr:sodium/calcium exchanger protein [Hirsutella rhossiliensis]KAH0965856.1 sodium/calcium exchanger protein [Hirsutella rhossiliensis]
MAVNHFRNKRQAHTVSRSSSDQTWNPFRHVTWGGDRAARAETWSARNLEHQPVEPLAHAATDPSPPRIAMPSGLESTNLMPDASKQPGEYARSGSRAGSEAKSPSHRSLNAAGLRNRRPEDESTTAVNGLPAQAHDSAPDDTEERKSGASDNNGLIRHVQPKTPFTVANQLQRTFLSSWINVLIIAAPVGIALNYVPSVGRVVVFVVNFVAIVPLAAMLSFATEEIALRTGETLGGLLNATFGNAVELIVAVIALNDNKVAIVKTSLIGSILSNLLLVMGCCFFFGGLRRQEQFFNTTVAQTAASLLALAAASVIVPSVFDAAQDTGPDKVAALSRGTAVILLLVYAAYLLFQLKTHQTVFSEQGQKVPAKPWSRASLGSGAIRQGFAMPGSLMGHGMPHQSENERLSRMLMNPPRLNKDGDDDDDEEEPQLHFIVALATLAGSTAIIALCAEYMVDSIDSVTHDGPLSVEFVGLILLPIVGNAAEHATAVTVAIKDKMDLAIGVAVGSSMQVALFLIPLLVVIGWGKGNDQMNLSFDFFQVAVMFVAVLLTNYLIGDGKSHWLEGFLLICLYAIIAVCSFYYPDSATNEQQSSSG